MSIELFAISAALSHAISAGLKKVVILSDSRSALDHVARCASGHRGGLIAYTIINKVQVLVAAGASLMIQWIPSHVGIRGNEEVDNLAREGICNGTEVYIKAEYSELLPKYKRKIKEKWKEYFDVVSREKGIWYKTIQSEPPIIPWFNNLPQKFSRKLIVIALRLRSGHMPLKKFMHLMKRVDDPMCETCGVVEDSYHFLVECSRSRPMRQALINKFNINILDVGLFQSVLAAPTSDIAITLYRSACSILLHE